MFVGYGWRGARGCKRVVEESLEFLEGSPSQDPEALGSAKETQMTPLESTWNRFKIDSESTLDLPRIDPGPLGNLRGCPRAVPPKDPLGDPNRNRLEPMITKT